MPWQREILSLGSIPLITGPIWHRSIEKILSQLSCWELPKWEITRSPGICIALSTQLYTFWHLCLPLFSLDSSSLWQKIHHKITLLAARTHKHTHLLIGSVFSGGCCCSGLCIRPPVPQSVLHWQTSMSVQNPAERMGSPCRSQHPPACIVLHQQSLALKTGIQTVVKAPGFFEGGTLNKLFSTTDRGQNPYALKKQQKRCYFQNLQGICNS